MTTLVPAPITAAQREQILTLHSQGLSRNAIAREAGVSAGTVTNVCRSNDLNFDRSQTKKATAGKQVDAKALRTALAGDALTVAKEAQDALRRIVAESSELNLRDLATVYGIFMDKHIALAKLDQGADTAATDSVVDDLLAGFRKQAGR